jgi:uncharacterized paraquat-inducible protein A
MAIVFPCQCGRQLSAPYNATGLRAKCPRCGATTRVPAAPVNRPDPTDTDTWRFLISQAKRKSSWGSRCI